jgi:hypothetical protein
MIARKFEHVKIGQTISFEENGMIETAIVSKVDKNTFSAQALRFWNNNGVKSFYTMTFNFLKTGTKSHPHYTYGNAIEITCALY